MKKITRCMLLACLIMGCTARSSKSNTMWTERDAILSVLRAVQTLCGPPRSRWDLSQIVSSKITHDFNADGQEELVVFFTDEGLGGLDIDDLDDLKDGVVTCGFLMLTRIDGRPWPVFYYFSEYRVGLQYKTVMNITGLVAEGGKGGGQTVWGWKKELADWPAQWDAKVRIWDRDKHAYGVPHIQSRYLANYGK